jgi:uncharacterized protein YbjT (DUF2867 family)
LQEDIVKITVTTPTGHIGSRLCSILLDHGTELTVIARHPEKVKQFADRGAKVIAGSHEDGAVLEQALAGSDGLFWVMPPNLTSHDPLRDARRFADVGASVIRKFPNLHVVQLSSVGAQRPSGTGPIAGVHYVEGKFRSVAKNVVALRANYFMENIFNSLQTIITDGNIYNSAPASTTAPQIATQDIAEIAADILLSEPSGQRIVDAIGPEDISFENCAEIISQATGKTVKAITVPGDKLKTGYVQVGVSPQVADLYIEMQGAFARGLTHELVGDEQRTGKVTYRQFIRDVFVPALKQASASVA